MRSRMSREGRRTRPPCRPTAGRRRSAAAPPPASARRAPASRARSRRCARCSRIPWRRRPWRSARPRGVVGLARGVLDVTEERVVLELAPVAGECRVGVALEVPVVEEDHLPLSSARRTSARRSGRGAGEVDPLDPGADRGRQRRQREAAVRLGFVPRGRRCRRRGPMPARFSTRAPGWVRGRAWWRRRWRGGGWRGAGWRGGGRGRQGCRQRGGGCARAARGRCRRGRPPAAMAPSPCGRATGTAPTLRGRAPRAARRGRPGLGVASRARGPGRRRDVRASRNASVSAVLSRADEPRRQHLGQGPGVAALVGRGDRLGQRQHECLDEGPAVVGPTLGTRSSSIALRRSLMGPMRRSSGLLQQAVADRSGTAAQLLRWPAVAPTSRTTLTRCRGRRRGARRRQGRGALCLAVCG